jgi:hypothetical protein
MEDSMYVYLKVPGIICDGVSNPFCYNSTTHLELQKLEVIIMINIREL